jgi:hypothetical protein
MSRLSGEVFSILLALIVDMADIYLFQTKKEDYRRYLRLLRYSSNYGDRTIHLDRHQTILYQENKAQLHT